jgi:hypothetical protein
MAFRHTLLSRSRTGLTVSCSTLIVLLGGARRNFLLDRRTSAHEMRHRSHLFPLFRCETLIFLFSSNTILISLERRGSHLLPSIQPVRTQIRSPQPRITSLLFCDTVDDILSKRPTLCLEPYTLEICSYDTKDIAHARDSMRRMSCLEAGPQRSHMHARCAVHLDLWTISPSDPDRSPRDSADPAHPENKLGTNTTNKHKVLQG